MANYLKADAVSIECELEQYLQPNQLNTVRGRSVLDTVAARYSRPFMLHLYGEDHPYYLCPQLDVLLGYGEGRGPSLNPALLGRLLAQSNCLGQVDLYNLHFKNPAMVYYSSSLTLRLPSGDEVHLIFYSQVLQYFSGYDRIIITMFAPVLPGVPAALTPLEQKLLPGTEQEELFKIYQGLPSLVQLTLRCIAEGKGDKAIKEVIKKGRTALSRYVRLLKDEFGVDSRPALMAVYRRLMPAD